MNKRETIDLIVRYLLLLIIPLGGLFILYKIFTPLTVYPVYFILKSIYNATLLEGNIIFFKGHYAEIIGACVAGAAYYLLLILNLTTPMHIKKRAKSILFLLISFLVINIIRIIVFGILFTKGYQYFDMAHEMTWYFGSTLIVILVWFSNVYLLKIRAVPIYTDMSNLAADTFSKKKRRNK